MNKWLRNLKRKEAAAKRKGIERVERFRVEYEQLCLKYHCVVGMNGEEGQLGAEIIPCIDGYPNLAEHFREISNNLKEEGAL